MKSKILKFITPLLILLIAGVGTAYLVITKPKKEPPANVEKAWPVKAITIEPKLYKPQFVLYGVFESEYESILSSTISANVNEVGVFEGDRVEQDKMLLQLDRTDIDLLYKQKEFDLQGNISQLKIEQDELARFVKLKKSKLKSASDIGRQNSVVTRLKSQKSILEAQLEQLAKDQARATIKSPFNAVITEVSVSPGNRVRPGDKLIGLYDVDHIQIRAQLPNRILAKVRQALQQGEKIQVKGEIDGNKVEANLSRVSAKVAASAVGVDAIFTLNSKAFEFGIGRSIKIVMELPNADKTIALPYEALYGLDTVYVIKNDRLEPVKILKQGNIYQDNKTYILAKSTSLVAGDKIVATQLPNAIIGLKVSISK